MSLSLNSLVKKISQSWSGKQLRSELSTSEAIKNQSGVPGAVEDSAELVASPGIAKSADYLKSLDGKQCGRRWAKWSSKAMSKMITPTFSIGLSFQSCLSSVWANISGPKLGLQPSAKNSSLWSTNDNYDIVHCPICWQVATTTVQRTNLVWPGLAVWMWQMLLLLLSILLHLLRLLWDSLLLQPSCRLTLKLRKRLIQSACQPTYHYLCSENFCDILLRSHSIKIVKLRQNLDACFESACTIFADETLEYRPLKGLNLDWGHSTSPKAQQALLDVCKQCKADRNCYIAIEDLELACIDGRPMKLGSSLFGVVSDTSVSMVSCIWRLTSILSLPYPVLENSQDPILENSHNLQTSN